MQYSNFQTFIVTFYSHKANEYGGCGGKLLINVSTTQNNVIAIICFTVSTAQGNVPVWALPSGCLQALGSTYTISGDGTYAAGRDYLNLYKEKGNGWWLCFVELDPVYCHQSDNHDNSVGKHWTIIPLCIMLEINWQRKIC